MPCGSALQQVRDSACRSKSAAELGTLLPPAAATGCRDLQAEGLWAAAKPKSPVLG